MGFFTDKVYTVTGAASGMARETALILAKKGAIVYAADMNEKGLEETQALGSFLLRTTNCSQRNERKNRYHDIECS